MSEGNGTALEAPAPKATNLVAGITPPTAIARWEPQSIGEAMGLANVLANSTIIPTALRDKPGNVLAIMMFGRELGMGTMQSILGIWIEPSSGRPTMYAQTLVGLVKQSRLCEWFMCEHSDAQSATYATQRRGLPTPTRLTVTLAEQPQTRRDKGVWKDNPAAMLRSRCSMALARMTYEEIAAGIYDPDDLDAIEATANERPVAPPPPPPPPAPAAAKAPPAAAKTRTQAPREPAQPAQAPSTPPPAKAKPQGDPPTQENLDAIFGPVPTREAAAAAAAPVPTPSAEPPPATLTPEQAADLAWTNRMRAALSMGELDAVGAEISPGVKDGSISNERAKALGAVYNECAGRIKQMLAAGK